MPQPAENIRVSQQGERILLEWSNPASYIDGAPLATAASARPGSGTTVEVRLPLSKNEKS